MSKVKEFINKKKGTLLCVGPMSKNCIDVSAELSNQFNIPLVLIASRRQIDADIFGGGYVENLTTREFSEYVHSKQAPNIYLARDHGGPWQSVKESDQNLNLEESMASAKKSFEVDIKSGFNFIHIDPSVPIGNETLTVEKILDRLFELYGYCNEVAQKEGKEIEFELGTEEQDGYGQDLQAFDYFLQKTIDFCEKNNIKKPTFVVAQTGTKVLETQNVGIFKKDINEESELSLDHLIETLKICDKYGLFLKEHNTDYLTNEALALRPNIGIHASNVAPEFGVAETKAFLYLLSTFGYKKELDTFVETAIASNKWAKWMLPNTKATTFDKAVICGHYIFSNPLIKEMKEEINNKLKEKNIQLDEYLKRNIKESMARYIQLFNLN